MNQAEPAPQGVGYHPSNDLNHEEIVRRSGDSYAAFILLRCPRCAHPFLHDYEHDNSYPDLNDLQGSRVQLGDHLPCPSCGYMIDDDTIWECCRDAASHPELLLTLHQVRERRLQWIIVPHLIAPQ